MKETDIAWLSGLCDGEGCFTISVSRKRRKVQLGFCLGMNNGDWIPRVVKIIRDDLGIPCHLKSKPNKGLTSVCISGRQGVQKLCSAIYPYSTVKRDVLERFIQYQGFPRTNQHKGYSEAAVIEAANLVDFVRRFNNKRNIPSYWTGDRIMEMYGFDPGRRNAGNAQLSQATANT